MRLKRSAAPDTTALPDSTPKPKGWKKLLCHFRRDHADTLDEGLNMLYSRLGMHSTAPMPESREHATDFKITSTSSCPRNIFYAPNMDGHVDPGEVVWFWAPFDGAEERLSERALVVVGRHDNLILGLITSPNPNHDASKNWLDIGSGPWDDAGRQSWVRLDKMIKVPETAIRRQGAVIPERRFNRIANRLRTNYGWA